MGPVRARPSPLDRVGINMCERWELVSRASDQYARQRTASPGSAPVSGTEVRLEEPEKGPGVSEAWLSPGAVGVSLWC